MTDQAQPSIRKRARQACVVCNSRRVKCNVTDSRPCQNCIAANIPCVVRQSRRGKRRTTQNSLSRPSDSIRRGQSQDISDDDDDNQESPAKAPENFNHEHGNNLGNGQHLQSTSTNEGSNVFNTNHGAESTISVNPDISALRESRQEDDTAVFLGESSSLRYVQNDGTPSTMTHSSPSESLRLRFPVPQTAKGNNTIPEWEAQRKATRIEALKNEGVFSLPSASICDTLLNSYFTWFHPCFPIVDRADVMQSYITRTVSPLLLQAILFVGVLHCDASLLRDLGGRERARYLFYNRAKDIYDADYEPHKMVVLQALFLLSFWRAGPLLEKDARHWLSAAISLAQSKAMHRTPAVPHQKLSKLQKRIWWSIYVRERQCAAALGLPNRIMDEDCDLEALNISDFEEVGQITSGNFTTFQTEEHISYAIGMVELAQFLGRIVHTEYLPNKPMDNTNISHLKNELGEWHRKIPNSLQLNTDSGEPSGFYANMLHLAYNNLLILLYRPAYMGETGPSKQSDGAIALQAACRNSRIVEDMLSQGTIRHGQVHLITNLFNTLCIHTIHMRRSDGTARSVAEHRAKLCLLGLQELQKTWEVTNWILELFFQYLDNSTAKRLRVPEEEPTTAAALAMQSLSDPNSRQRSSPRDQQSASQRPQATVPINENISGMSQWPWTAEEADNFLLSQIQNEFAFGEGGSLGYGMGVKYNTSPSGFTFPTSLESFVGVS